jgi:hypothetical protein
MGTPMHVSIRNLHAEKVQNRELKELLTGDNPQK